MKRGSIDLARSLCVEIAGATDENDGDDYGSVDVAEILSAEVVALRKKVDFVEGLLKEQLERAERAEADNALLRQDTARLDYLLSCDPEEFITDATGSNAWKCESKAEFCALIDAAIAKDKP